MRYCRRVKPDAHLTSIKGWTHDQRQRLLDWALAAERRPAVLGIAGAQGSGKSTLAALLVADARQAGLHAAALSIDDFYLTRSQRQRLARRIHPLLATRGPPGSHDVPLALTTLDTLRHLAPGQQSTVPRFDKLADTRRPPSRWPKVTGPLDLIVLEGWCLGAVPETEAALAEPINALEAEEDSDGRWRRWVNAALAKYPPLWRAIDRLLFLAAPDFETVPEWRWQQERELAAGDDRRGMSRAQLNRFVQHYERLTRHMLRTMPAIAGRTVVLDAQRRPAAGI